MTEYPEPFLKFVEKVSAIRPLGRSPKHDTVLTLGTAHALFDKLLPNTIAIGISPRDDVMRTQRAHMGHGPLNDFIKKSIRHTQGMNHLFLIGEFSPDKHRWHYHGIASFKNVRALEKIRGVLEECIGRTETEQIRNAGNYEDYCFKMYEEKVIFNTIQPFVKDSYILLQRSKGPTIKLDPERGFF